MLLAGGVAEQIEFPGTRLSWQDEWASDWKWIDAHYRKENRCPDILYFDHLPRVEARLRECWLAVERLATELLKRGYLPGREAERIVMDALPRSIRQETQLRIANADSRDRAMAALRRQRLAGHGR